MALEMTPNVEWVGTIDWHERDFHGFTTERGVTYNAYLVRGERTALIDTVKARFAPAFVEELRNRTGGIGPHFVVCNHAEPDHAGGLPALMEAFPSTTLLCNAKCRDILAHHYAVDGWKVREVTHGEEISLGGRTLRFIDTPMLHWPESMATYLPEEKLLFSMDIFGQHVASSGRFDDEVRWCVTLDEAKSYFANIVQPYARKVPPLLETLRGLEMEIIAPSHGVVWRSRVAEILEAYEEWSSRVPRAKVLVLFDTMWESTERMAGAIVDGASAEGVEVVSLKVGNTHLARIATGGVEEPVKVKAPPALPHIM